MAGKLVHFELPARDAARAKGFWTGVFGWQFSEPMGMEYFMTQNAEGQGGAVYPSEEKQLLAYFDTDDIEATIEKVRASGGTADDKQPVPHVGWFAHCTDTEGNKFGVFESDESVSADG
jgi:hypothetical protein